MAAASKPEPGERKIRFADEQSRIVYETVQKVVRLAEKLPPEGQVLNAQPITFAEADRVRGLTAIRTAGTVIYTDQKNVRLVPERSLKILQALQIPYEIVSSNGDKKN